MWHYDAPHYSAGVPWWKGALHFHSRASDGGLSPAETVRVYAELGYDFVCLTDHERVVFERPVHVEGILVLPGFECYDVLAVGTADMPPRDWPLRRKVEHITRAGGFAVVVHPHYLALRWDDVCSAGNFHALEIFNNYCEIAYADGYAVELWDLLLRDEHRVWGVASDDAHLNPRKPVFSPAGCGWVMVQAEALEPDLLVGALKGGAFYASQGPLFDRLDVAPTALCIVQRGANRVRVVSGGPGGGRVLEAEDEFLLDNRVVEEPGPYVRIELVDEKGRRAWSNPIWTRATSG